MVVHDLHVGWSGGGPSKTDPPLVVDANTVLSLSIAFERLQPVLGRRGEVAKLMSAIKHFELSSRDSLDIREPRHARSGEQKLRAGVREGDDHLAIV